MKFSLHIEGTRVKPGQLSYARTETEPYDVVKIDDAALEKRALANTLRAIADSLDPPFPDPLSMTAEMRP